VPEVRYSHLLRLKGRLVSSLEWVKMGYKKAEGEGGEREKGLAGWSQGRNGNG